eukprot:COSAG01_NODE_970_length_12375_cov_27.268736_3_plen_126_part_00
MPPAVGTGSCMAERASVACMQKILRILLLRPENPCQPRSSGNRTGFSADFLGALRAQILQCVGTGGWLSERCMRRCRLGNHISVAPRRRAARAAGGRRIPERARRRCVRRRRRGAGDAGCDACWR